MYHAFRPGPPLAPYVNHFWLVEQYSSTSIDKLLPDGGLELILNLGGPQYLLDTNDPRRHQTFRDCWVSGQRTQAILIGSPTPTSLIGVRFRVFGAFPLLHLPLAEITDRVIDAASVCGRDVLRLRDRIVTTPSPRDKFAILEEFLIRRLRSPDRHERLVSHAVEMIGSANDDDPVRSLGETTGLSGKHLRRLFHTMVGLSPKALHRVFRLQRVLGHIEQVEKPNWPLLAQTCGFFDQAHFINEFKSFTGLTPTEYLSRRGAYLNYLPMPELADRLPA